MSNVFSWRKFNDWVLKLKLSQVTDVAEKEFQELMADQVAMTEPKLSFCLFVECSHLPNILNFSLL